MKRFGNYIPLTTLLIALLAVFAWSCKSGTKSYGSNPPPSGNNVSMSGSAFNPSTKTVAMGTTITWTNFDGVFHSVTSDTGTFLNSPTNIPSGGTYSKTFGTTGSFYYHCVHHGTAGNGGTLGTGMAGVVIVQ